MLEPVGFWSYTRRDDVHSDGQLSQLRLLLGNAIGRRLGREIKLFQDTEAIPAGADWAADIEQAISKVTFFIPVVSPALLRSKHCCDEFRAFRRRMDSLGRSDLIFPIHYVDVEHFDSGETVFGEDFAALRRSSWVDYRNLYFEDARSPRVKQWADRLALSILDAMRRHQAATNGENAPMGQIEENSRAPRSQLLRGTESYSHILSGTENYSHRKIGIRIQTNVRTAFIRFITSIIFFAILWFGMQLFSFSNDIAAVLTLNTVILIATTVTFILDSMLNIDISDSILPAVIAIIVYYTTFISIGFLAFFIVAFFIVDHDFYHQIVGVDVKTGILISMPAFYFLIGFPVMLQRMFMHGKLPP